MSFASLKVADLRDIAASYGAEDVQLSTKKALIQWLDEEGVTYSSHEALTNAAKASDQDVADATAGRPTAPVKGENLVLLKMERSNPGYDAIGKYFFTREHPYQAVPRDDANEIFRLEEGFRLATDDEVREFYS